MPYREASTERKKQDSMLYTYRCGEKVYLKKRNNQFVVSLNPKELEGKGFHNPQRLSPSFSVMRCEEKELVSLMKKAGEVAPTFPLYERLDSQQPMNITDGVIVRFKESATHEDIGKIAGHHGLRLGPKLSKHTYRLQVVKTTEMDPVKTVITLMETEKKFVENVDHDCIHLQTKYAVELPDDPAYERQWHLHTRRNHPEFDPRASSQTEAAWHLLGHLGDPNVVVAFSDDGCQLDHPDFSEPNKFAGWAYFQGNTLVKREDAGANPDNMYETGQNHGTAVAGVIGAEVDGLLTAGAVQCQVLPIKWESEGPFLFTSDAGMLQILEYIENKADVFSNSWGGAPITDWADDVTRKIRELALNGGRRGKGIVFLWAAGNENCPISHSGNVAIPYTSGWDVDASNNPIWVGVETSTVFANNLVGIPGVMHVAALASTAQRSHYSNYGEGIGICAATSNAHRYQRIPVSGLGVTTTTGDNLIVTDSFGGTSSATPLVAGIAALVISANPELTGLQVIETLKMTASKDLEMTGYPRTPPASFDLNTDWDVSPIVKETFVQRPDDPLGSWSPWFGYGKVDAAAAVQRALELAGSQAQLVKYEKLVDADIPDNDPAGIVSTLHIPDQGKIETIQVRVELTHTYIGDLVIRLLSPGGQAIPLHNRGEGGTDNIFRTYDETTTLALSTLKGQDVHGTWLLEISDHAPVDQGQLIRWGLEATVVNDGALRVESSPGTSIPDNNPIGIADTIAVAESRTINDLVVEVDITHTYIGDLRVELLGPNGAKALLHNRTGQGQDNLTRGYTLVDSSDLAAFTGQTTNGNWVLEVKDLEGQDIGKLNRWGLTIA